jgi:hypothetical protein
MATRVSVQNRVRASAHEGFLTLGGSRWVKIALVISIVALGIYIFHDPQPRPNGGTWYGYTLGTIGALLILWLTALGIRKRAMTRGRWSLKSWTSAHVWLGLSLIVIGTLHTGFQFGWNVHTLAYALMMLVIASGLFGVFAYATLPRVLSDNRNETTEPQMLEQLRSVDRQLHETAQPLGQRHADLVRASLEHDPFGGGFSMTSWPTLTMQSDASTARWTKSPALSAAQPTNFGCRSSITPLPSCVVRNGIPVLSTNSRSIFDVIVRFAPAPMTRIGDFAASSLATAAATAFWSALGRRATLRGIGTESVCSSAMSSGNSR